MDSLGEGVFIIKKIDLRSLLKEAIEKAKDIDHEKVEREIEEESNQLAKSDSKFVLDNNLIIVAIKSGWTRNTDLLFTMMPSDATLLVILCHSSKILKDTTKLFMIQSSTISFKEGFR